MNNAIEQQLTGSRWIVQGVYELSPETKSWVFSREYRPGTTVWEFTPAGTLIARLDGHTESPLPFTVMGANLYIGLAPGKHDPTFDDYKLGYMVVPKTDGLWLYDIKAKIADGRRLALKLVPEL